MNKQQMLNGMSEEEFYSMYPTEEDYVMAMGGQAGNDDFYVPHQDADRLRASTPINFVNTPFYQEGGNWGGTYRNPQYIIDKPGALKKAGSAARTSKDVKVVPEKNPMRKDAELSNDEIVNFARNRMADASQPYNFRKTMEGYDLLSATDRDKITNLMKTEAFTNLMQEDFERRKKQGWFETYPEWKARTEVVYNLGGASDGPLGYFQEGGNPSPMNYGAFPVMVGGGEFTMIINDLLKKQFGGDGTDNPAPSIDSVIDDKKNFFNTYIRGQVGQAMANEMKNEMQQQMMAGAYMQDGGPYNPYANADTGITGNNENLSMQMAYGGDRTKKKTIDLYRPENTLNAHDSTYVANLLETPAYKNYIYSTQKGEGNNPDKVFKTNKATGNKNMIPVSAWNPMVQKQQMFNNAIETGQTPMYPPSFWPTPEQQIKINESTKTNSVFHEAYQIGGQPDAMDRADVTNKSIECSPEQKMDASSTCYDKAFAMQQMNIGMTQTPNSGGYNFMQDVAGDKTGAPYEAQQTPFSKENSQGQSLNNTENNPLNMGDNSASQQEAYNATKTKGPGMDWTKFMPNGMDQANKILSTLDFVTNRLDARENKRQEKANKGRYSGDAVLEARPEMSSSGGDYDINSGRFRPRQYVPVQFPGTNYGNVGTNQYAQMGGGFKENEDVYMSDEEIQQYLAAGGEIEFLD